MKTLKFLLLFSIAFSACCPLGENCAPVRKTESNSQIKLDMIASQGWYPSNSTIKLTFTAENISPDPIEFYRVDGPVIDIVYSSDPTQRWSARADASVDIHNLTLQPGETKTIEWEFSTSRDDLYGFDGILWIWDQESHTGVTVMVGSVRQ